MQRSPSAQLWLRQTAPLWLVAAAVLVAAFLRLYHLTTLAPEAWFDEIWFALRARDMLEHPQFIVFYKTAWGGGNGLMVYLTAIARWLGFSGLSASRYASATLGVLATPLAYACFNEMLKGSGLPARRWIAALAATVCAALLYWVIVARVGTEPSLSPAAALFCVWQIKVARRKVAASQPAGASFIKKYAVIQYVLLGLVTGLSQYDGPHARFIVPLVGVICLHELLSAPAPLRKRLLMGYGIAALSAVVIAAPLIAFFVQNPDWFFARAKATTAKSPLTNPALWRPYIIDTLRSFNFVGPVDSLTNYPTYPMFDWVQSIGFFVGHGWAVWNLRRSSAARDLLMWEVLMVIPSLLTSDAPNFQRMIGAAAPAACLIAIGWVLALRWLWTTLFVRPLTPIFRAMAAALAAGIVASPFYQAYVLLVLFPALIVLPHAYIHAPVQVAHNMLDRVEAGERVFVSRHPEDDDIAAFEFLFRDQPAVKRLDFRQCLPLTSNRPTRTSYVVLTGRDHNSVPILYHDYPTATLSEAYYFQDNGTEMDIPANTPGPKPPKVGNAQFDSGLTFVGYEWSGPEVPVGQSLFITLWWQVDSDQQVDYTSFIHVGTGLNGTQVIAQRDGQPCQGLFPTSQWRKGDLVRDSFAITFPLDVAPGQYPLAVGWYTYPDQVRLHLLNANQPLPDDRAVIGTVTMTK
jgi:hypothetical protein